MSALESYESRLTSTLAALQAALAVEMSLHQALRANPHDGAVRGELGVAVRATAAAFEAWRRESTEGWR